MQHEITQQNHSQITPFFPSFARWDTEGCKKLSQKKKLLQGNAINFVKIVIYSY